MEVKMQSLISAITYSLHLIFIYLFKIILGCFPFKISKVAYNKKYNINKTKQLKHHQYNSEGN